MKKNKISCLGITMTLLMLGLAGICVLLLLGPVVGNTYSNVVSNLAVPAPHSAGRSDDTRERYHVTPVAVARPTPAGKGDDYAAEAGGDEHASRWSGLSSLFDISSTGLVCSGYSSGCGSYPSPTRRPTPTPVPVTRQYEPLRAGELDDNANWAKYLRYRQNYFGPGVHDREVSERHLIEVKDRQGRPVLDATVRIFTADSGKRRLVHTARTYATGQTLFHPLALGLPGGHPAQFVVEVQKGEVQQTFTLARTARQSWSSTLDTPRQTGSMNLDLLFLIDATGSMADEIDKIQRTIFDVAARVDQLSGQAQVRYGLVAYRDRGDSFVTRVYDFTPEVGRFSANLNTIDANAGGDYPESLNEGLHQALHDVTWRDRDTVRLIFLVADAPPHLDYPQDYDYAVEMDQAVQHGIKIFPIASSGLDDQGQYIFRQLAQYTQGRFIFLTSATPSGAAAGGAAGQQGQGYSVANLDDLLVHLVRAELAHQNPDLAGASPPGVRTGVNAEPRLIAHSPGTRWLWPGVIGLLGGAWLIWGWTAWPPLRAQVKRLAGPPDLSPQPAANRKSVVNPTLQRYLEQARSYRKQIDSLTGKTARPHPQNLTTQVEVWSQAIESLAHRIDYFQQNPLITQDLEAVPQAVESLEARLARETDPAVRPELERTLAKRVNQLALLAGLQSMMRQAELQIEHTLSALGTIHSQLIVGQSTHHVADYNCLLTEIDEEVLCLQDHLEALQEVKMPPAPHLNH